MVKCLAIVNQLNEKEVEEMIQSMDISAIQCRLDHHFRTEETTHPQTSTGNYSNSHCLKYITILVSNLYKTYISCLTLQDLPIMSNRIQFIVLFLFYLYIWMSQELSIF